MEKVGSDTSRSVVKALKMIFVIFGAIIIPVLIYTARSLFTLIAARPLYYLFSFTINGLILSIALAIAAAVIYTLLWWCGVIKPSSVRGINLFLAIVCASVIAYFAPVIPTLEARYFYEHRDEFDHQAALMRQDPNHPDLRKPGRFGPYTVGVYIPRSSNAIVFSYYANDFKSEYAYVYTENYADLNVIITCAATDGSGGIGEIYATLSPNWYLCYRTAI